MTDSIIQHLLENKKHTANHRNSKKTTTFVFNKCSVTYLRKCPIIQYLVSDSGHSTKGLKRDGTTRICKAMKYNDLHLSIHSVYLSKQRLYRLKWMVADNQWCKYAASTCSNDTGVKLLLSTPTSYCVGYRYWSRAASIPVLFCLVWTCPNSCHTSLYPPSKHRKG